MDSDSCFDDLSNNGKSRKYDEDGEFFVSKYDHLKSFLASIHNQKVWSEFKLRDANFNFSITLESNPSQFDPLINLHEMECLLAQFALTGTEEAMHIFSKKCNTVIEGVRQATKAVNKMMKIKSNAPFKQAMKAFLLDCHFAEAETLIVIAALEIYQKNFMSASHLLLKTWKKYHSIGQKIEHLKQIANEVYIPTPVKQPQVFDSLQKESCAIHDALDMSVLEGIGNENQPTAAEVAPKIEESTIQALERQIAEKTTEIRSKQTNRRGPISEEVIELTKDLLQLKQLYKDLKGTWKSSDGHADASAVTTNNKYFISNVQLTIVPPTFRPRAASVQSAAAVAVAAAPTTSVSAPSVEVPESEKQEEKEPSSPVMSHPSLARTLQGDKACSTPVAGCESPVSTTPKRESVHVELFASPVAVVSREGVDDCSDRLGHIALTSQCAVTSPAPTTPVNTSRRHRRFTPSPDAAAAVDKENTRPLNVIANGPKAKSGSGLSSSGGVKVKPRSKTFTHFSPEETRKYKQIARDTAREELRKERKVASNGPSEAASASASAFSVPTVHVLIPGLPDLYSYFMSSTSTLREDPKKRNLLKKSTPHTGGGNGSAGNRRGQATTGRPRRSTGKTPTKVTSASKAAHRMSGLQSPYKLRSSLSSGAGTPLRSSASKGKRFSFASPSYSRSHSSSPLTSPLKERSSYFVLDKNSNSIVMDYNSQYSNRSLSVMDKTVIEFESRLAFATGLFSILGSVLPPELSWILALINVPTSVSSGVSSLYNVHLFKESIWSNLASLVLLNLPPNIISSAFKNESTGPQMAAELRNCVNSPEQFYALIEAQSMVHIARNPLFQWTLARNYKVNSLAVSGSCLSFRIDRFRRATKACVGSLTYDTSFYLSYNLAKCCLFAGDWEHCSPDIPMTRIEANQSQFSYKTIGIATRVALHTMDAYKSLKTQYIYTIVTSNMTRSSRSGSTATELSFEMSKARATQQDLAARAVTGKSSSCSINSGNNVSGINITGSEHKNAEGDRNYSSILDLVSKFTVHQVQENEMVLRQRLETYLLWGRTFNQAAGCGKTVLQMMSCGFQGDADSWLWLLPVEMTYLTFRSEELVCEANHTKMLQTLDQGALMFADNVLIAGTTHDSDDERNPYRVLANLISALVLNDLANRDCAVVQASINPKNAVEIYNEKSFLNGNSSLRLKCVPRSTHSSTNTASDSGNGGGGASTSTNIYSIIREIKDKTKTMTASIGLNHLSSLRNNSQSDNTLTGLQVAGDIVVCWLLLRGLVLMELGKAWDAGLMFNLVDSLSMFATVSKFVVPAASYHMAELVLNFTVCDRPIMVATEYLHRASSYLTQPSVRGKTYTAEYCHSIQELVHKMER